MIDIQVRTYFSIQHLKSAYLLSLESKRIEEIDYSRFEGLERAEMIAKNTAFVTGSLFASVSFLEATIREMICDIIEGKDRISYLSLEDRKYIETEWNKRSRDSLERISTLKKYKKTLQLLNVVQFDKDSKILINLDNIIKVRNTLVHYKPEDYSIHSPFISDNKNQYELTDFLDGKFEHSVFYKNSGNPFFPHKCLGYGFSDWVLINTVSFVDEFHRMIGLKPIYNHIRKQLLK